MSPPYIRPREDEIYVAVMAPEVPSTVFRVGTLRGVTVDIWGWPLGNKGNHVYGREPSFVFNSVDDLPAWMKNKLAVLSTLNYNVVNEQIPNVGARVSKNVFWVYPDPGVEEQTGECFGEYARSVGQASGT